MPTTDRPTNRRGRQLDPSRDAAIIQAALDGLAELGYDLLSMDEIAARAHAGKGALYRRWPSKAALVADAVVAWRDARGPNELPDTGSLAGDLEAMIDAVPDPDESAMRQMSVFMGLVTAANRDPELRAALSDHVFERPRSLIRELLQRAVSRGEIPANRDLELIPDALLGLSLLRILLGLPLDREYVRRVASTVFYPAATGEQLGDGHPDRVPRSNGGRATRRRGAP